MNSSMDMGDIGPPVRIIEAPEPVTTPVPSPTEKPTEKPVPA